jgi:hypothetical protein
MTDMTMPQSIRQRDDETKPTILMTRQPKGDAVA